MGLFFNFNTAKARQFHYRPLYYNERKERLEKMKAEAEATLRRGEETHYLRKGFLTERRETSKFRRPALEKSPVLRFLLILLVLIGLLCWFLPGIVEAMLGRH